MGTRRRVNKKTPVTPIVWKDSDNDTTVEIDQLSEENRALYLLISSKFESTIRDLELKIAFKDEKIEQLEFQVCEIKKMNMQLTDRVDDMKCRERCNTLILSGNEVPASDAREIVVDVTREILKEKLKCNVNSGELLDAHRIGKKNPIAKTGQKKHLG